MDSASDHFRQSSREFIKVCRRLWRFVADLSCCWSFSSKLSSGDHGDLDLIVLYSNESVRWGWARTTRVQVSESMVRKEERFCSSTSFLGDGDGPWTGDSDLTNTSPHADEISRDPKHMVIGSPTIGFHPVYNDIPGGQACHAGPADALPLSNDKQATGRNHSLVSTWVEQHVVRTAAERHLIEIPHSPRRLDTAGPMVASPSSSLSVVVHHRGKGLCTDSENDYTPSGINALTEINSPAFGDWEPVEDQTKTDQSATLESITEPSSCSSSLCTSQHDEDWVLTNPKLEGVLSPQCDAVEVSMEGNNSDGVVVPERRCSHQSDVSVDASYEIVDDIVTFMNDKVDHSSIVLEEGDTVLIDISPYCMIDRT